MISLNGTGTPRNLKPRKRLYFNAIHGQPNREDCPELDSLLDASDISKSLVKDLSGPSVGAPKDNVEDSDEDDGHKKSYAGLDISELEEFANQSINWIVEDVFSGDQPIVFGAGSKCTKTLHLVDLCVALAKPNRRKNGETLPRKWLETFDVPKRRRVLFITGESNNRAITKLLVKCAKAHKTTLKKMKGFLRVEAVEVPSLGDFSDLAALTKDIELYEFDVVILDPLYVSLSGLEGSQLEHRGAAIRELYKAVQPATVIISHHFTKTASRGYGELPYLEDLTGSGLAESAGNWWLMKRNVPYAGGHIHDLVVVYGGRDGQFGQFCIQFDEEEWSFNVTDYEDYKLHKATKEQAEKSMKKQQDLEFDTLKLIAYLSDQVKPLPKTTIRDEGPVKGQRFANVFDHLEEEGEIKQIEYKDSQNRKQKGWMTASAAHAKTNNPNAGDAEEEN